MPDLEKRISDLEDMLTATNRQVRELKAAMDTATQVTDKALQDMAKAKQAMDHAHADGQALRKRVQKLEQQDTPKTPPNPQEPKRRGRPPGTKNKRAGSGEPTSNGAGTDMGTQAQA